MWTISRESPRKCAILKYYSFENYFLNPAVMVQIGSSWKRRRFYRSSWKMEAYLYKIKSGRHLTEELGFEIQTEET